MPSWRSLSTGAFAALLAGCTLLVSTSGLSGDPDDKAEGGSDAGNDATSASDGTTLGDSGDAAPPPPFCASRSPQPLYCLDFDTAGAIVDQLGNLNGAPTLDATQSLSKPRSLLGLIDKGASTRSASVTHNLGLTPTTFSVDYDVFLEEYDASHDVELATLYVTKPGTGSCTPQVAVRGGLWTFSEYCVTPGQTVLVNKVHGSPVALKLGTWTHVHFAVDYAKRTFSTTIDTSKIYDAEPIDPGAFTGDAQIVMGIYYLQTVAGRAKVYTDNVTVDAK